MPPKPKGKTMKSSEIIALIVSHFEAKIFRPLLIEGSPGLGKSQLIRQAAEKLGVEFKMLHAPLLQPEDYGFPVISSDKTDVDFIVSRLKFPIEGSKCAVKGILGIDDLGQCEASTQKIIANAFLEREIHGKNFKKDWLIVATGNRVADRAGSNRLLSHLGNRVTRIEFDASLDDWSNWALSNNVQPEIVSFIRFKPDFLTNFNPQNEINATPRAWVDGVAASLGKIPKELELAKFSGDVGKGPASEFMGFLRICRQLPSVDEIALNPDTTAVPHDSATLYAICGALAYRSTSDNFGRLLRYIQRIPDVMKKANKSGGEEFSVLFVRDATSRNPDIAKSKDFIAWASGDGAKILT